MTKAILTHQINRLAKIYISKPVCTANVNWHNRVGAMQVQAIKLKKTAK